MNIEEVKNFINDNKESEDVKTYLQDLNKVNVEGIEKYVTEDEEGKKWVDSIKDKHFNKALDTWKTNNLTKLIDDEVKKKFPSKDEKDIEVENLKVEIEKMKQEKIHEALTSKAIKIASDKSLPLNLVDFFIAQDEEATVNNLKVLEESFNKEVQKAVEKRLKNEGYNPPKDTSGNTLTLENIKNMSQAEINKNWDKVKEILKNK
ncbi:DUF4355 domain-containing protein [Clostridium beijerinckii]|uniref:DUF4355 domain-containing protein n=1 Tax=Clostridium beijerinckii TaxID=1520 RepID=A0AAW3W4T9_CLOBE|nr:DUF4355 domain-containing protein [Clostridium beijerinckii]MBC2456588.1 DUF4355 domain-containing protein [Clostridium beijerinckii]MBC2473936.1 DUF4355 domain-containing protein [Clostridium beijerinckii]NOV63301.1 hypothetical protein [Clostridium beijerinckii]NOV69736.1 hypothetical protein [Clostridium beijerinckii]NOW31357.1 hypothetical protein [Clostridium beijerinckii]